MTERITISDSSMVSVLQRWIISRLQGSERESGLYYLTAHGVADWDIYNRTVGAIAAYESILAHMNELAKADGAAEEKVVFNRPGLN